MGCSGDLTVPHTTGLFITDTKNRDTYILYVCEYVTHLFQ